MIYHDTEVQKLFNIIRYIKVSHIIWKIILLLPSDLIPPTSPYFLQKICIKN